MKSILFFLPILFVLHTSAQPGIDVLHYKFTIGLNDINDTIHGLAEIKVKFLKPSGEVTLDLTGPLTSGKGMKAGKVESKEVMGVLQSYESINLRLTKTYNTGDTTTFLIPYSGIPSDGLIISKTKYGRRSFFADNWPDRAHHWIPCNDHPADKATVEFMVTAPEHYQVVANGILVEEKPTGHGFKTTHWKEDTPISTKVMVIGVAEFAIDTAGYVKNDQPALQSGIPVYSYVYPENKEQGFYDYSLAKDILPFFINYIGPYGFKKLANVQSRTRFGGLENANTIFYSESSVTGTRRSEGLLAHEIAHQWFGNMATEKNFGHLWLSEGFATCFTILYFENKYGRDTAIAMLKEDREQVIAYSKKSNRAIVDTAETDYMKLLNANNYQKGGWVLHMLRSELGDSVFRKAIRKYYAIYAGGSAGTDDLQKVFEEVAGKDLKYFFLQWLYTPGQPNLKITWKNIPEEKKAEITVTQLQAEPFRFPLDLYLITGLRNNESKRITITQKTETFHVPLKSPLLQLDVDYSISLLYEGTVTELK
jgi:aminopeptidase N